MAMRTIPRPFPLLRGMKLRPERHFSWLAYAQRLHMVARKRRSSERGYAANTFRLLEYPKCYGHFLRHAGSRPGPYRP